MNEAYSSFSTERRRWFGVNLALTLDRPARTPVLAGWSVVMGVIGLLLPPGRERGTAWGLHPIGAGVVEPGVEVKLRLLDALDWQRSPCERGVLMWRGRAQRIKRLAAA